MKIWGFLRETREIANKAGIDKDTGICRTGLDEYLEAIFPNTTDWVHDSKVPGVPGQKRPDYRSESLKLIIEFDGLPHFQYPKQIIRDIENTEMYEKLGYKVIRIPYFIQLTNDAVQKLFDVRLDEKLFDPNIPSLDDDRGSPASLCPAGIDRMAEIFSKFPEQYEVNISHLKSINNDYLTGASLLEIAYNKITEPTNADSATY